MAGSRVIASAFNEADHYSKVFGLYVNSRDARMASFAFTKMGALDTAQ
jgi:hypothetical protein